MCDYCRYSTGDDYLATLDFSYADRRRDWAVLLGLLRVTVREVRSRFWKK